ncbi:hypothetical protein BC828DRAFT_53553 [Blastocladiella britannica]|nr:hypothetical protein BC828DRAFT_53553 [Blastocladiella britannica]
MQLSFISIMPISLPLLVIDAVAAHTVAESRSLAECLPVLCVLPASAIPDTTTALVLTGIIPPNKLTQLPHDTCVRLVSSLPRAFLEYNLQNLVLDALAHGNTAALTWLYARFGLTGFLCRDNRAVSGAVGAAAARGHIETLVWWYDRACTYSFTKPFVLPRDTASVLEKAMRSGSLDTVQWAWRALEVGTRTGFAPHHLSAAAFAAASVTGSTEVLEWIAATPEGAERVAEGAWRELCVAAKVCDTVPVVEWWWRQLNRWSTGDQRRRPDRSARKRNVTLGDSAAVAEWVRANKVPYVADAPPRELVAQASVTHQTEMLDWWFEHDSDPARTKRAGGRRQHKMGVFALQSMLGLALREGSVAVMTWIAAKCEGHKNISLGVDQFSLHCDVSRTSCAALDWALAHAGPLTHLYLNSRWLLRSLARHGRTDLLQWFWTHREHFPQVQWEGRPRVVRHAVHFAIMHGHVSVLDWFTQWAQKDAVPYRPKVVAVRWRTIAAHLPKSRPLRPRHLRVATWALQSVAPCSAEDLAARGTAAGAVLATTIMSPSRRHHLHAVDMAAWISVFRTHHPPPPQWLSLDSISAAGDLMGLDLWWLITDNGRRAAVGVWEGTWTHEAVDVASMYGLVHVMQWWWFRRDRVEFRSSRASVEGLDGEGGMPEGSVRWWEQRANQVPWMMGLDLSQFLD